MTEDQIKELKEKHGKRIAVVPIPATEWDEACEIVVKAPPRGEYKRFRKMLFDDTEKADALETLAKACVIHPELQQFQKMLDDRPALAETVGGKAAELAGAEGKVDAKKL